MSRRDELESLGWRHFVGFRQGGASSHETKTLHQFSLKRFSVAVNDYDGHASKYELDMVERAAKDVCRLGRRL